MMLQEIAPHVYHNEISWKTPEAQDYVFSFSENHTLYLKLDDQGIQLPTAAQLSSPALQYLFSIDDRACYLDESGQKYPEQDGWCYTQTGSLREAEPSETRFACAVAESLSRWYAGTKFCGRCGSRMEKSRTERAMVCPHCKNTVYPKICPAVIVAVYDGDRLLLTRYQGRAFKRYALIAGFSEIGESVEETVRREVLEEVGVRVKNLRFYKSQPWVYTDTLLMGFYAELDGSSEITLQEDELSEGTWFRREEIPTDHSAYSLTGEMIEHFRAHPEKF